jgi:hypothetical protein
MGTTWIFIIGTIILAVFLIAVTRGIDTHGVLAGLLIYGVIGVIAVVGVYEGVCWLIENVSIVTKVGG